MLPYLREIGVVAADPVFEAPQPPLQRRRLPQHGPPAGHQRGFRGHLRRGQEYGIGIVLDGVFSHTAPTAATSARESRYGEGGAYRDLPPLQQHFDSKVIRPSPAGGQLHLDALGVAAEVVLVQVAAPPR